MEDREIMSFRDEDGNKVDFEASARIYLEEVEYLILTPLVDGEAQEDSEYVYRIDVVDGNKELNVVEDDKEFLAVKKEYQKLLY